MMLSDQPDSAKAFVALLRVQGRDVGIEERRRSRGKPAARRRRKTPQLAVGAAIRGCVGNLRRAHGARVADGSGLGQLDVQPSWVYVAALQRVAQETDKTRVVQRACRIKA